MRAPTKAEVKLGYDGITRDGTNASITGGLAILAITDPLIKTTLDRFKDIAYALGLSGEKRIVDGLVNGAYISGLHMGLHIGEARAKEGGERA